MTGMGEGGAGEGGVGGGGVGGAVRSGALAEATARLYAVAPEDFVATRTLLVAEARAARDPALAKEIGALRKPTVAAWAVNLTVRERPHEREGLLDVGRRLRGAQAALDAATLRALRSEREDLLSAFTAAAAEVTRTAGRPLGATVLEEVRGTVVAALADEQATAAVLSGTLARALHYSGFGEVDLSEAVARTSSGAVLTVLEGAGTPLAPTPAEGPAAEPAHPDTAEGAADGAAAALASAETALADAEALVAGAEADAAARREQAALARDRVHEAEAALARAREEQRAADEAVTTAVRARSAALAARHTAERALRRARAAHHPD
ncbi:MAG TPA: hypothetical protein VH915_04680 [Pedococcus sp.]